MIVDVESFKNEIFTDLSTPVSSGLAIIDGMSTDLSTIYLRIGENSVIAAVLGVILSFPMKEKESADADEGDRLLYPPLKHIPEFEDDEGDLLLLNMTVSSQTTLSHFVVILSNALVNLSFRLLILLRTF